jgi:plasmid stabilization system protein ParE
MTRVVFAEEVGEDFDRILEHLYRHDASDPPGRIAEILAAIEVLRSSPLIGRPTNVGQRELIIGKDSHGYVALYRHVPDIDAVFVQAIHSQREAGYAR